MVANADHVCIAKVLEYAPIDLDVWPRRFSVKFAIAETMKTAHPLASPSRLRKFQIAAHAKKLAECQEQETRLLIATDWENADRNLLAQLDTKHAKIMTGDFELLRDSQSVIREAKEAIRRLPPHSETHPYFFQLAVPQSLVSQMNLRSGVQLQVPADERLEEKAQVLLQLKSPQELSVGLRAIRYFRTTENIAATRKLLHDLT